MMHRVTDRFLIWRKRKSSSPLLSHTRASRTLLPPNYYSCGGQHGYNQPNQCDEDSVRHAPDVGQVKGVEPHCDGVARVPARGDIDVTKFPVPRVEGQVRENGLV